MAVNRSTFFFSFQVLDSEIIYARDYDYNYFGFKVLYNLLLHKFESDITNHCAD